MQSCLGFRLPLQVKKMCWCIGHRKSVSATFIATFINVVQLTYKCGTTFINVNVVTHTKMKFVAISRASALCYAYT